jgi:DNA repair protein RecO (recombination protein O)
MIESATGLILRTRPLTETSLIVQWLTPEFGRIATVAQGARRHKSPFIGKLDLFYLADFSFSRSRRSDLHTLREINLRETNSALRENMSALRQVAYAIAFVEQATETETPLPRVYELMREFLDCLRTQKPVAAIVLTFELKLLRELGLEPDWAKTGLAAGTKKIAAIFSQKDFTAGKNLKLAGSQMEELRQFLHGFLIFHLGKLPKGRAAALADEI